MGSCSLTHFTVHTFIDTTSSCPLQMFRLSCGPSTSVIVELMNETALPHAMVHTPLKIDTTPRLILWTADFRVTRSQSFRHQTAPDFILSFNSRWLFTRWCPVFCSYHTWYTEVTAQTLVRTPVVKHFSYSAVGELYRTPILFKLVKSFFDW